jgi:hypothetical protein
MGIHDRVSRRAAARAMIDATPIVVPHPPNVALRQFPCGRLIHSRRIQHEEYRLVAAQQTIAKKFSLISRDSVRISA